MVKIVKIGFFQSGHNTNLLCIKSEYFWFFMSFLRFFTVCLGFYAVSWYPEDSRNNALEGVFGFLRMLETAVLDRGCTQNPKDPSRGLHT